MRTRAVCVALFASTLLLFYDLLGQEHIWISPSSALNNFSTDLLNTSITERPSHDVTLGLSVGIDVNDHLTLSVGYDRVFAQTDPFLGMSASLVSGNLEYLYPLISGVEVGIGGSLGLISASGSMNSGWGISNEQSLFANGLNGEDPLFRSFGTVRWRVASRAALSTRIGYRWSRVELMESDSGVPLVTSSGRPLEASYSATFLEVSARVYPFH